MRFRYAFVVVLIALVVLSTMSVIGQEEPLPPVRANSSAIGTLPPAAYVSLAVEPLREPLPATLAGAARNNDFVSFNALYNEARQAGRNVAAYDTLHQLWSWSMSDPVGAFYGTETYERLRAAYPGYAAYIDEFRIVDRHGAVFYPTSETRAFLLDRALAGNAPRILLAETAGGATAAPIAGNEGPRASTFSEPAPEPLSPLPGASSARGNVSHAPARAAGTAASSRRRPAAPGVSTTTTSAVEKHAPTTAAKQTPATTGGAEPVPAPISATASATTTQLPAATTSLAPLTAAPAIDAGSPAVDSVVTSSPSTDVDASAPLARESVFANRGLLLLIIGLVGIGLLAVMLRTPQELPTSIMPNGGVPPAPAKEPPSPDAPPVKPGTGATVEPMRPKKHAGGSR